MGYRASQDSMSTFRSEGGFGRSREGSKDSMLSDWNASAIYSWRRATRRAATRG